MLKKGSKVRDCHEDFFYLKVNSNAFNVIVK